MSPCCLDDPYHPVSPRRLVLDLYDPAVFMTPSRPRIACSPPPLLEEEAGLGHVLHQVADDAAQGVLEPPLEAGFQSMTTRRMVCIYKKGDDLRQDQLVLQMFRLMDRIFRKENLDLRLITYRVVATGRDDGLVEFIPSSALVSA